VSQFFALLVRRFSCTQLGIHQLQEMHHLSLKEGFFVGMHRKRGQVFCGI